MSAGPPNIETIQFDFDPEAVASADVPRETNLRLFWLFLTLLRYKAATYRDYYTLFEREEKTFRRDVNKLRLLGKQYGFELTVMRQLRIGLKAFDGERRLPRAADHGADALRALAEAFGDVVAASIGEVVRIDGTGVDRFLHVASPRLQAGTAVGTTYRALRAAWSKNARVRFRYPDAATGKLRERTVEPYAVTYYTGRYYLVGWDARPRVGWRQFALDRIDGAIVRAGTFRNRSLPPAYAGRDAIGLFKSATQTATDVTVRLSPRIAGAVTARIWQAEQRVEMQPDRSALFTFTVYDIGEAVRWACGFGVEATVVAPPKAVELARDTAEQIARRYAVAPGEDARRNVS